MRQAPRHFRQAPRHLPNAKEMCLSAQATQPEVNTRVYWEGIFRKYKRKIENALRRNFLQIQKKYGDFVNEYLDDNSPD